VHESIDQFTQFEGDPNTKHRTTKSNHLPAKKQWKYEREINTELKITRKKCEKEKLKKAASNANRLCRSTLCRVVTNTEQLSQSGQTAAGRENVYDFKISRFVVSMRWVDGCVALLLLHSPLSVALTHSLTQLTKLICHCGQISASNDSCFGASKERLSKCAQQKQSSRKIRAPRQMKEQISE